MNKNVFPRDEAINAYPGSMTDEKAEILDSNENKQLRTITLHDGTNSHKAEKYQREKSFRKTETVSLETILEI